jgi:hypothetical protein
MWVSYTQSTVDASLQMPAEWTTKEQKAFLKAELVLFKKIGSRNYTKHWEALYNGFFQQWPERLSALPGVSSDAPLTEDQRNSLATAVTKRQKQIQAWMRWNNGAGDNRAANNKTAKIINDLLKPKTRLKKPWEIYSKKYYTLRVQQEVEAGTPIVDVNKKIRDMFENESPEIQEEIYELQKADVKKKRSRSTSGQAESDEDDELVLETDPLIHRR